jgi:hypothetical protein
MPRGIHNTGVKQNNIVFEPQIPENKVVTTSNDCQRSARRTYGGLCHRGLPKCSVPSIANKPQHCKIHNEGSTCHTNQPEVITSSKRILDKPKLYLTNSVTSQVYLHNNRRMECFMLPVLLTNAIGASCKLNIYQTRSITHRKPNLSHDESHRASLPYTFRTRATYTVSFHH